MNILICPHQLVMGGSQINAIELAAAVRDRGHKVTLTGPPGVLVSTIAELGLDYVPTPETSSPFPTVQASKHILQLSRRLKADLVHAYEWRPAIESAFGPHMLLGTPLLITVLSMDVPGFLPRHVPLVVGTPEIAAHCTGPRMLHVLEPPIDVVRNAASGSGAARARWNFADDEIVVGVVGRLTSELHKLQGVLEAMEAVTALAHRWPLRLLVAGGGEGLEECRARAATINTRHEREIVIVTGELVDPRDVYDASDIMLGMGSSALKGMAFSKPLVVQGTHGFWRLLEPDSAQTFLWQGWFGHGGGGAAALEGVLDHLAGKPLLRSELGYFGRSLVERRFSLDRAADRLIDMYRQTIASSQPVLPRLPSLCRSAARVAKFRAVTALRSSRSALAEWATR